MKKVKETTTGITFRSIIDCARYFGLAHTTVCDYANKARKYKHKHYDFIWIID